MDDESEFEDDDEEDPLPVLEEDDAMDAEEPEEPEDDRLETAIADLVTVSQPAEIEDAAMEPVDEPEVERPRGTRIPRRALKLTA